MKNKYSYELKVKVVEDYLQGELGYRKLAKKYGLKTEKLVPYWVNQYTKYGKESLQSRQKPQYYSLNFKLEVLKYKQKTGAPNTEVAQAFGLPNPSVISNWKKRYLKEGIYGLDKRLERERDMPHQGSKDDSKSTKRQETPEEKRLRKENEYLRTEIAYIKKLQELGYSYQPEDDKQK